MSENDRLNSVKDTENEKKLKRYALNDPSDKVREIAASKISDQILLAYIACNDKSMNVVRNAVKNIHDEYELKNVIIFLIKKDYRQTSEILMENIGKITDLNYLMDIFKTKNYQDIILKRIREINPKILFIGFHDFKVYTTQKGLQKLLTTSVRLNEIESCLSAITDENFLAYLAFNGDWRVNERAVKYIVSQDVLEQIASSDNYYPAREAIKKIKNQDLLEEIALKLSHNTFYNSFQAGLESIERITNEDVLKVIALTGTNPNYREKSVKRIKNHDILKEIAFQSHDENIKSHAIKSINDCDVLLDLSLYQNRDDAIAKINGETRILYDYLKKMDGIK